MSAQTTPITERQLTLITRAQRDTGGWIEPLLELKGGAKLKMIESLAQRGLIEQMDGQWRITPAAIAIIKGEPRLEGAPPPTADTGVAMPPLAGDPEWEAAVAAETSWQQDQPATAPKRGRDNSKQALVIAMLRRPEGATIAEICEATGWQPHTVRGLLAGALKKRLGLAIVSERIDGPAGTPGVGQRLYRIAE